MSNQIGNPADVKIDYEKLKVQENEERISVKKEDLDYMLINQARLYSNMVEDTKSQILKYKKDIKTLEKMIRYHEEKLNEYACKMLEINIAIGNIGKCK